MVIPVSNIEMFDINFELGRAPNSPLDVNDQELRILSTAGLNPQNTNSATEIDFSDFRGKARIKLNYNTAINNVNLLNDAVATNNYAPGKTYITVNVDSSAIIGSSSISLPAFDVNLNVGDVIELNINGGYIVGAGGRGGNGSGGSGINRGWASGGSNGEPGGTAIEARVPLKINNNGYIWGGGGGGAGGDGGNTGGKSRGPVAGNGGGGGAGATPGGGGNPGYNSEGGTYNRGVADPGQPGTLTTGGAGGYYSGKGPGGEGGNPGIWGISRNQYGGGAPGFYLKGASNATWVNQGNVAGQTG